MAKDPKKENENAKDEAAENQPVEDANSVDEDAKIDADADAGDDIKAEEEVSEEATSDTKDQVEEETPASDDDVQEPETSESEDETEQKVDEGEDADAQTKDEEEIAEEQIAETPETKQEEEIVEEAAEQQETDSDEDEDDKAVEETAEQQETDSDEDEDDEAVEETAEQQETDSEEDEDDEAIEEAAEQQETSSDEDEDDEAVEEAAEQQETDSGEDEDGEVVEKTAEQQETGSEEDEDDEAVEEAAEQQETDRDEDEDNEAVEEAAEQQETDSDEDEDDEVVEEAENQEEIKNKEEEVYSKEKMLEEITSDTENIVQEMEDLTDEVKMTTSLPDVEDEADDEEETEYNNKEADQEVEAKVNPEEEGLDDIEQSRISEKEILADEEEEAEDDKIDESQKVQAVEDGIEEEQSQEEAAEVDNKDEAEEKTDEAAVELSEPTVEETAKEQEEVENTEEQEEVEASEETQEAEEAETPVEAETEPEEEVIAEVEQQETEEQVVETSETDSDEEMVSEDVEDGPGEAEEVSEEENQVEGETQTEPVSEETTEEQEPVEAVEEEAEVESESEKDAQVEAAIVEEEEAVEKEATETSEAETEEETTAETVNEEQEAVAAASETQETAEEVQEEAEQKENIEEESELAVAAVDDGDSGEQAEETKHPEDVWKDDQNVHTVKKIKNAAPKYIGDALYNDPIFAGGKDHAPRNEEVFVKIKNGIKVCILAVLTVILIALVSPMFKKGYEKIKKRQAKNVNIPKETQKFLNHHADNGVDVPVATMPQMSVPESANVAAGSTSLPITLEFAENLYFNKEYSKARIAYNSLYKHTADTLQSELLIGFLRMRIGQCFWELNQIEDAEVFLKAATDSESPIVQVLSNYYLAENYLDQQKYLQARIAAYRSLAMADIPDDNIGWVEKLKLNSRYMAAEATTRYSLALYDADDYAIEEVWSKQKPIADPFMELNEKQLSIFLTSGSEKLRKSIIAPVVIKNQNPETGIDEYSATCQNATAYELIARTAQNANMEVTGQLGQNPSASELKDINITLYVPNSQADQIITIASGCAGLLAQFDGNTADIADLTYFSSLSEYVKMLSHESVALWREISYITSNDNHTPGAHFALALLYAKNNKVPEALAEYKLITVRFPYSNLAQRALLNSAKLKASIHNYSEAREDLQFLVEQYPETKIAYEGLLYLADLTMKIQLYDEACRLYTKVYYFSIDSKAQAKAALGAGKSYCELNNYEQAAKWLSKYMLNAKKLGDPNRYSTCYLLGTIYLNLGQHEEGYNCLKYSLQGKLSKIEHLDAIESLVNGYIKEQDYISALDVLESDEVSYSSNTYAAEILLLKSSLLRSMGLIDSNIKTLEIRIERMLDNEIKARALFELGLCYQAKDNLKDARNAFIESFGLTETTNLSNQVAWQIAQTCYELAEYEQVFPMCTHIIENSSDEELASKAHELLASSHYHNKDYNKALAILTKSN